MLPVFAFLGECAQSECPCSARESRYSSQQAKSHPYQDRALPSACPWRTPRSHAVYRGWPSALGSWRSAHRASSQQECPPSPVAPPSPQPSLARTLSCPHLGGRDQPARPAAASPLRRSVSSPRFDPIFARQLPTPCIP